jgi:hypothetical protein
MVIRIPIIKETQELNSADTIHGESIHTLFNKNVENTKEAKLNGLEMLLIEATRALALVFTEKQPHKQDDDNLCNR